MGTDEHDSDKSSPVVVTEAALRKIEGRLKTRLRAFFQPGEKVGLSVEDAQDFVFAKLSLSHPGQVERLELEAAIIAHDQDDAFLSATTSRTRMLGAIEFLAEKLEAYFRSQRHLRFHVDYRLYSFEAATVRFRGRQRRPSLENKATELLEQQGAPEDSA